MNHHCLFQLTKQFNLFSSDTMFHFCDGIVKCCFYFLDSLPLLTCHSNEIFCNISESGVKQYAQQTIADCQCQSSDWSILSGL